MDSKTSIKKISTGRLLSALNAIYTRCILAAKTGKAKQKLILVSIALAQEDTVRVKFEKKLDKRRKKEFNP
jgi:hypothetical protein